MSDSTLSDSRRLPAGQAWLWVLSLGAALAFLSLAFTPGVDASGRARRELLEQAERWRASLLADRGAELVQELLSAGDTLRLVARNGRPTELPSPISPSDSAGEMAFDTLLRESVRLELQAEDPESALAIQQSAGARTQDPVRSAFAALRECTLLARAGRQEAARERAPVLDPRMEWMGVPLLLRGAVAEKAWNATRYRSELVDALQDRRLALDPERCEGWVELACEDQAFEAAFADWNAQRRRAQWDADIGALRTGPALYTQGSRICAAEPAPDGSVRMRWLEAEQLWSVLRARALRRGMSEDGFDLAAFDGSAPVHPAERVGQLFALDALPLTLELVHRDPQSLVDAQRRGLRLRQLGWSLAALLALGVGFASRRALQRERELVRLRSQFVANVSHELRTPVGSLLLMSENLAQGRVREEADRARYHALMQREATRLARLVDDVLDVARLEQGREVPHCTQETELEPWAANLLAETAAFAAAHSVELLTHSRFETRGSAALDVEALRRAVFNLIDNARKHGCAPLEFSVVTAGRELTLSVRDHGPGMSAAERARASEPYWRSTQTKVAGAGLGLAIVSGIARRHGGRLDLDAPEQGTGLLARIVVPLKDRPMT